MILARRPKNIIKVLIKSLGVMQHMRYTCLACFIASILLSRPLIAGEHFDAGLLQSVNGGETISDTALLSQGYQPAGLYRVHIDVNGQAAMVSNVRFELNKDNQLVPCLSFKIYKKVGVDMSKIDSKSEDNELKNTCKPMEEQIPGTRAKFTFSTMKLDITVPQTVLRDENVLGVPEEEWDDGIPALITMYQLSGQQYINHKNETSNSVFANLTNGINLGRWRYRNLSTVSNDDGWKNNTNYVETAIHSLKGELILGDASTPSDVFDSLLIRGLQLSSDDDMTPDQLTGFAPIIRGIAKSNAQVTIRENGYVIYQRYVPPGPFMINDLSSVSNGGKLEMTVTEADGSETRSTVSYSNVPQLLRKGIFKYSFAAGHFQTTKNAAITDPEIVQGNFSYGLPYGLTAYGGTQYNQALKAFSAGIGANLQRIGGVAFDITSSQGHRDEQPESKGSMMRLTYRNNIPETDTDIQLDNRYYRKKYLSFNDWAEAEDLNDSMQKRREYNLTVNQGVTAGHSLYLTLNRTENADNTVSRSWQFGWNGAYKLLSFSLGWSMTRSEGGADWDKQLAVTLSAPLGGWFTKSQPMVNYTATSGMKGDLTHQVGITGHVADREDLNWNSQVAWATKQNESDTQSGSLGMDYQGKYGELNATYTSDQNQYVSWNASGSVLVHPHGITMGRYSNNSLALVAIPGAADVPLDGGQYAATDWRGYAIVPDIRAYHRNTLNIDTRAAKTVDFVSTSARVVPTKDAIVLAKFEAIIGRKSVMTVTHNGKFLPFGARASVDGSDGEYYVGDQGQVYINKTPDSGVVNFRWGDKQKCTAPFKLPADDIANKPVTMLSVDCH